MPSLLFQLTTIAADLMIFLFVGYYLIKIRSKEKNLEKKEGKIDTNYHQIVDNALAKERKILEDATNEADQIITGAQYIRLASKETVDQAMQKMVADIQKEAVNTSNSLLNISNTSKETVNQTMQKMVSDIQKEAVVTTRDFMNSYQTSLKQLASQSLKDFQNVVKGLEIDLQKQIKDFHETLLPNLEKELEDYKQARLKQTEQTITRIIQQVSQETLNKSISLNDHQNLLIESLEKAKKEGIFD